MYLCICNEITEKDLEEYPELAELIGTCCGKCISDGADTGFDGASEQSMDSSNDHVTVTKDNCKR